MLQHTVLVLQSLDKERHGAVCWGCRACRLLQGEQAVCAGGLCITQVERGAWPSGAFRMGSRLGLSGGS